MAAHPGDTHTLTFRVRYEECGAAGAVRASVYLHFLQELAFAHSAALGFPLAWYEAHRLFWLVRRIRLTLHAPARYADALEATTQVVGMQRVFARRRYTIRREADGASVATAVVDWIFTENGTTPKRVPPDFIARFPALAQPITPSPLPEESPPAGAAWTPLRIRSSDVDAMGHANHAVYLDLLDDAIVRAGGTSAVDTHPRTYDLEYHAAASAGTVLRDVAWLIGEVWHYRLEAADGLLYLHGRLTPAAQS